MQLPAINSLRSKSEHSAHRTPRKDKEKQKSNNINVIPTVSVPKLPSLDPSRVIAEAQVGRGVMVTQSTNQQANANVSMPLNSNNSKDHMNPISNYTSKVSSKLYIAEDDDDDFLDDDSLSGADKIFKAQKKPPKSSGVPQFDEGIRMEYEEDSRKVHPAGANKHASKIPTIIRKTIAPQNESSNRIENAMNSKIGQNSIQSSANTANTFNTSEDISDVSSQEGRAFRSDKQQKNIGFSPNVLFEGKEELKPANNKYTKPNVQPQLGMIPNMEKDMVSDGSPNSSGMHSKKKIKKVWKMAPIPIKPYIALAAPTDKFH